MKTSIGLASLALITGGLGLQTYLGSENTSRSSCVQTVWLLMSGSSLTMPTSSSESTHTSVMIIPNVAWDDWNQATPTCAQPTTATLELTFSCNGVTLPAEVIIMPTPTVPGMQPLPDGGQILEFQIPAGTITEQMLYHNYAINGEYLVTFDDGSTSSSLYATTGLIIH